MKTTILLFVSLFFSTSIFAQVSFDVQSKAAKTSLATDNSLTMNISEYIMQANPNKEQIDALKRFDKIGAVDITLCQRKNYNCGTIRFTKWSSCKELNYRMDKKQVDFSPYLYIGCEDTENGVRVSLVTVHTKDTSKQRDN